MDLAFSFIKGDKSSLIAFDFVRLKLFIVIVIVIFIAVVFAKIIAVALTLHQLYTFKKYLNNYD